MKRFYTLLAGAMVASGAFALTPSQHQLKNVDLSALTPQKLEKINPQVIESSAPSGMMKVVDATGKEWSCLIAVTGDFTAPLELDSFDEYPYYWMNIAVQPHDESGNFMQFVVAWPSRAAALAETYENIYKQGTDGLILNEEEVLQHFSSMEEARAMASFDEVAAMPIFQDGKIQLDMLPGCYYMPCIITSRLTGVMITWNGDDYCPMSALYNSETQQWDYSNVTSIVWESFDAETSDIAMDFDVPYTTYTQEGQIIYPGTTRVSIASAQLSGTAVVLGFGDIMYPSMNEIHIFNAGRQEYGIGQYTWSYNTSFDPLNYYFICFCDPTMSYMVQDNSGNKLQNFTDTTLPIYQSETGAPGWAVSEDYHFTYMKAALWAPENSENPYGLWKMGESDYTMDEDRNVTYMSPAKAYNLVEPLNCAAGVNDGFSGRYEGYVISATAGQSWLGVGDKDYGLNFKFSSTLTNGYYFMGSYKGDIIYHGTPGQWLSNMTYLPAVGTGEYNALDQNSDAVKTVVSDSPVVSSTYYNFQGQRLASEPQHGLYIVRSVKADGTVVSKKVAK